MFLLFLLQYRRLKLIRIYGYSRFDIRRFPDHISLNAPTISFIKYGDSDNALPLVETVKEGKK